MSERSRAYLVILADVGLVVHPKVESNVGWRAQRSMGSLHLIVTSTVFSPKAGCVISVSRHTLCKGGKKGERGEKKKRQTIGRCLARLAYFG